MRYVIAFLIVLAVPVIALPATIHVPADYATIQEAIDAAANGDTVIVHPGTYVENIDFLGKAILVQSLEGPEKTVLDGNEAGSVVTFQSGEGLDSILDGFVLTNGSGTYIPVYENIGGGIYCDGASPTITNCTIRFNTAQSGGGIAVVYNASPHIVNNTITENLAIFTSYSGGGGGIAIGFDSSPLIKDNVISYNSADNGGSCGGIGIREYCNPVIENNLIIGNSSESSSCGGIGATYDCSGTIKDNVICDNWAGDSCGGIGFSTNVHLVITDNLIHGNSANRGGGIAYWTNSSANLTNNMIYENSAAEYGGGFYCSDNCSAVLTNNMIYGNSAAEYAGGIACYNNSSAVLTNNMIYGNSAAIAGGGIDCLKCFPADGSAAITFTNDLIYNNAADVGGGINSEYSAFATMNSVIYGNTAQSGGGIACLYLSDAAVTNTILWNNDAPDGKEILIGDGYEPSYLSIDYSDVEGGQASVEVDTGCTLVWEKGSMIQDDPQFKDPSIDDFHLTWLSPCINRGTNDGAAPEDMDGDLRPWVGTTDMGADEFTGTHPLEADKFWISEASGGTVNFALTGDAPNGGRNYLLLGSVSGTCPSTALPGGIETLRLNWDWFTELVLLLLGTPLFLDFHGKLDVWGNAASQLNLPPLPPGTAGITMHYAYCLNNPFDFVSNPVAIEVVP
ncbi:MAG: right-handed parallel beta-helix repeat-containing protein [Planctomycetota bacterium]|jgi:hypothetical protein